MIGNLKKDEVVKNEFRLTQIREGISDLKSLSRMYICVRFEISSFNASPFKLLKVEFVNPASDWRKYASELTKSGYFEIQLF